MEKTVLRTTSLLGALFGLLFCSLCALDAAAQAQSLRPEGTYLRPRLGASFYNGDRDPSGYFQSPGPSTGIEYGINRRLGSLGGGLGLMYILGRYPRIVWDVAAPTADNDTGNALQGELAVWRHTVGLVGRTSFAPEARVDPYLQLGVGTTVTLINSQFDFAFSPIGGAGVDIAITDQVGIFLEATGLLGTPDYATDQAESLDSRSFDWLGFYGGGIRINLSDPAIPPAVIALDGPTRLETATPVTFVATVNDETVSDPVEYRWDLGDGTTGSGLEVSHRFEEPGNYTLTFTAMNEGGADEQVLNIAVAEPAPPPPPPAPTLATSAAEPNPVEVGEPVRFNAEADSEGPVDYTWTFGDGTTDVGGEVVHVYEEPGTYMATLEASNSGGAVSESVQIRVQRPSVVALSCNELVEFNAAFFDKNAATLREKGRQALTENLAVLEACPDLNVRVEALAAPDEQNQNTLAAERADAVERFYVDNGIASNRIIQVRDATPALASNTTRKNRSAKDGLALLRRADSTPVPTDAMEQDEAQPSLTEVEN